MLLEILDASKVHIDCPELPLSVNIVQRHFIHF